MLPCRTLGCCLGAKCSLLSLKLKAFVCIQKGKYWFPFTHTHSSANWVWWICCACHLKAGKALMRCESTPFSSALSLSLSLRTYICRSIKASESCSHLLMKNTDAAACYILHLIKWKRAQLQYCVFFFNTPLLASHSPFYLSLYTKGHSVSLTAWVKFLRWGIETITLSTLA